MCKNPIRIINKSYALNGGPRYLTVPCGHCSECSNVKLIDYFLRTWSVYRELIQEPLSKGLPPTWSCWFVTLTFNEDAIPRSRVAYLSQTDNLMEELADYNTNVVKNFQGSNYIIPNEEIKCFDHTILSRFLKSYRLYYRRLYTTYHYEEYDKVIPEKVRKDGKIIKSYVKRCRKKVIDKTNTDRLPHCIFTSEYGSKNKRPHYHGVIFVPRVFSSWKDFQSELNRFWHYGFTCDNQLSTIDGITSKCKVSTAIKYTLKYITKGDSEMPFYLNHGQSVLLNDISDSHYTPRVFTSNGFGSFLERLLTHSDYVNNKITLNIEGQYKTYNVPSYLRRRYFVRSVVDSTEEVRKSSYWSNKEFSMKTKSHVEYKHDYAAIRDRIYIKGLYRDYQRATMNEPSTLTADQFVKMYLAYTGYNTLQPQPIRTKEFDRILDLVEEYRLSRVDRKNRIDEGKQKKEQLYYSQHKIEEIA